MVSLQICDQKVNLVIYTDVHGQGGTMVLVTSALSRNEKEALLIMFGTVWRKKFSTLDGRKGRPSITDCIDIASRRLNSRSRADLVYYIETYLQDMARRCESRISKD
jgi:hypothetical protein